MTAATVPLNNIIHASISCGRRIYNRDICADASFTARVERDTFVACEKLS
jgi:hypothetical protein